MITLTEKCCGKSVRVIRDLAVFRCDIGSTNTVAGNRRPPTRGYDNVREPLRAI